MINEIINEFDFLCEICKHCHSYLINTPSDYEWDIECLKNHQILSDEEKECEDFELATS